MAGRHVPGRQSKLWGTGGGDSDPAPAVSNQLSAFTPASLPACHPHSLSCSYGMFTHAGPTEQQIKEASFSFTNIGKGYSKGEQGLA